jgi:hypothetical protein
MTVVEVDLRPVAAFAALYAGQMPTQANLAWCTRVGRPQLIEPDTERLSFKNTESLALIPAYIAIFNEAGVIIYLFDFREIPPDDEATLLFEERTSTNPDIRGAYTGGYAT